MKYYHWKLRTRNFHDRSFPSCMMPDSRACRVAALLGHPAMFQIIFLDGKFRIRMAFMFLTGQYSLGCFNTTEALGSCKRSATKTGAGRLTLKAFENLTPLGVIRGDLSCSWRCCNSAALQWDTNNCKWEMF